MYIFITKDGRYVGIDQASGGYPYITDNPLNTHSWFSAEEALSYRKIVGEPTWELKWLNGLDVSEVEE